jgi:DNA adenine methylase
MDGIMAHKNGTAQPFLKWAGGKGQLLKQYEPFFPVEPMRQYYEPFAGSSAVFFHLRGRRLFQQYILSDANPELINCYLAVRDHLDQLIDQLRIHQELHDREHYYAMRDKDRDPDWHEQATPIERAARLIYLNKTCYNGLWRVNSQGYFNVPMGSYKKPDIANVGRLCAASFALQGVQFATRDFSDVLDTAQPGDFVYFDPPYVPLSATSNFTSYAADDFGPTEQRRLRDVFVGLDRKGVRIMLSNSDTELVRNLYQRFRVGTVTASRRINSNAGKRGEVSEIVVTNY